VIHVMYTKKTPKKGSNHKENVLSLTVTILASVSFYILGFCGAWYASVGLREPNRESLTPKPSVPSLPTIDPSLLAPLTDARKRGHSSVTTRLRRYLTNHCRPTARLKVLCCYLLHHHLYLHLRAPLMCASYHHRPQRVTWLVARRSHGTK
jgi:hypothetical protein